MNNGIGGRVVLVLAILLLVIHAVPYLFAVGSPTAALLSIDVVLMIGAAMTKTLRPNP